MSSSQVDRDVSRRSSWIFGFRVTVRVSRLDGLIEPGRLGHSSLMTLYTNDSDPNTVRTTGTKNLDSRGYYLGWG